jgi:hypothetical protein
MAFLRFHRDKRGYEHFYLVEATTNRRGKSRARVLYWFRTPPNVKVGREPFDDDVRRALEAQNPGVQFDWQKISETPIPSADAERWRERRRLERATRSARRAQSGEPADADLLEDDDGIELPESAAAGPALDAAEQQADALAPTEESLVRTAATVEPSRPRRGHRRRRTNVHRVQREPTEPREPHEPHEPHELKESDEPEKGEV